MAKQSPASSPGRLPVSGLQGAEASDTVRPGAGWVCSTICAYEHHSTSGFVWISILCQFCCLAFKAEFGNVTENTYLNWGGSSLLPSMSAVTCESLALQLAGSTARGVGCVGMLESSGLEKAVKGTKTRDTCSLASIRHDERCACAWGVLYAMCGCSSFRLLACSEFAPHPGRGFFLACNMGWACKRWSARWRRSLCETEVFHPA